MRFKPEDFKDLAWFGASYPLIITDIANAKLEEWLAQAPSVGGENDESGSEWWPCDGSCVHSHSYTAKLVCIESVDSVEEIKK